MNAVIKLSSPGTHEFWEIPVVFEDTHLLALDKPAGLLLTPDRYDPDLARPNLMRLLHDGIAARKPWAKERGLNYLSNANHFFINWLANDLLFTNTLARRFPILQRVSDFMDGKEILLTLSGYLMEHW